VQPEQSTTAIKSDKSNFFMGVSPYPFVCVIVIDI